MSEKQCKWMINVAVIWIVFLTIYINISIHNCNKYKDSVIEDQQKFNIDLVNEIKKYDEWKANQQLKE